MNFHINSVLPRDVLPGLKLPHIYWSALYPFRIVNNHLFFLIVFCASACLSARGGRTIHTRVCCSADRCIRLKAVMVPLERVSACLCCPESCTLLYDGEKGK